MRKIKIRLIRAYYVAPKDRDPVMARLGAVANKYNGTKAELAKKSGVAAGTTKNWWDKRAKRPTRYPQFATVVSVARALGSEGEEALFDTIRKAGRKGK